MKRRAFTIVEMMVTMVVAGVMLAIVAFNIRSGGSRATPRGAAQWMLQEMQVVRAEALRLKSPTAVCFPTEDGTQGFSAGFYCARGEVRPQVTRWVRLEREARDLYLIPGLWPVSETVTNQPPVPGGGSVPLDVSAWESPHPKDPALIFLPDGTVTSNGIWNVKGDYLIALCAGGQAVPTGAPSGMASSVHYVQLTKANSPSTIRVSPLGEMSVEDGLTYLSNPSILESLPPYSVASASFPPHRTQHQSPPRHRQHDDQSRAFRPRRRRAARSPGYSLRSS